MKKTILFTAMSIIVWFCNDVQAQQAVCQKQVEIQGEKIAPSRGAESINIFRKKVGKRKHLKCPNFNKKRGAPSQSCDIVITNESAIEVDVFIDNEYYGSIKANDVGVIEKIASYSQVFVLSADDKINWKEKGDCACQYSFKLKPVAAQ